MAVLIKDCNDCNYIFDWDRKSANPKDSSIDWFSIGVLYKSYAILHNDFLTGEARKSNRKIQIAGKLYPVYFPHIDYLFGKECYGAKPRLLRPVYNTDFWHSDTADRPKTKMLIDYNSPIVPEPSLVNLKYIDVDMARQIFYPYPYYSRSPRGVVAPKAK